MPNAAGHDTIDQRTNEVQCRRWEFAVEFWQWLVLVLGVLVLSVAVFYGIQVRRRQGGIVAQRSPSAHPERTKP
jgi:hypothetical protein